MSVELERRTLTSFDGTRVAYYVMGPEDGPPLVISAGLGGGVRSWARIMDRFASRMRIVAWDYRGLYGSERPADGGAFDIHHHARDLICLLEHEKIERPVLMGWSMGVQVNYELHRTHAHVPRALIAIHGATCFPLDTAFEGRFVRSVSPAVFSVMRRHWRSLRRPMVRAAASRRVANAFMALCCRMRIMSGTADPDVFYDMARDWVELDLNAYAEIFERLAEHDARELLAEVRAPTLVVAGGLDRFTPPEHSHQMADEIEGAELFVLPEATHFGPLEYPDEIVERIERFFSERLPDVVSPPRSSG